MNCAGGSCIGGRLDAALSESASRRAGTWATEQLTPVEAVPHEAKFAAGLQLRQPRHILPPKLECTRELDADEIVGAVEAVTLLILCLIGGGHHLEELHTAIELRVYRIVPRSRKHRNNLGVVRGAEMLTRFLVALHACESVQIANDMTARERAVQVHQRLEAVCAEAQQVGAASKVPRLGCGRERCAATGKLHLSELEQRHGIRSRVEIE
eukprot:scaffold1147_cov68-Phaeocystis_antarctica.AAC.9